MASKIDPKAMKIRGFVADAFLERFWDTLWRHRGGVTPLSQGPFRRPFSTKSRKNSILKSFQKSMLEKHRKLMPKGSKMMPKWIPKSMNFHTFPKKAKTLQTLCFPIYFDVLGMQNRCKIDEKSMQNRCWKKACKKYGK